MVRSGGRDRLASHRGIVPARDWRGIQRERFWRKGGKWPAKGPTRPDQAAALECANAHIPPWGAVPPAFAIVTLMARLPASLLICLCLGLASLARADPEVHVVAVGKGYQTNDFYALPEARVLVDRPGREVDLVLLDGGRLHWKIELTAGTFISEVIRSGPGLEDSKVSLSGIEMSGVQTTGLPLVFRPSGRVFRDLVRTVTARRGAKSIHSFQGMHKASAMPVRIDRVDTANPGLAPGYLSQFLSASSDLPPKIRNWTIGAGGHTAYTVAFVEDGISLTDPSGTRRFPVTPGIPRIILPVSGVYDPGSQMIYCLTYGAEGYLYSVDTRTGAWAVVTSLEGYDAAGLLYDPDRRLLITTGAFSRPGEIKVFGLDGSRSSTFVPITGLPGLTDLYDYGNEHGPPLAPRVFSDGWLLLEARARRDAARPDTNAYRVYAVQIATGEARLLEFHND